MQRIIEISVVRMTESCERTTYYVRLETDEGFHTEPCCWRTGSVHMENGKRVEIPGLSIEEARQRALSDAGDWADLLRIPMTPYFEDGVEHVADWNRNRFTIERAIRERRRERASEKNRDDVSVTGPKTDDASTEHAA